MLLLPLILSFLTFSLFRFSLGIATPRIIYELSLNSVQTGFIFSSNLISMAIGMVLVNRLRLNSFKFFLLSSGTISFSLILLSLSWDYLSLILSVVLMGLGSGLLNPLFFFLMSEVSKSKKGLMLGIGNVIYSLGGILGPPLMAFTLDKWRYTFLSYGFLALISLILSFKGIPSFKRSSNRAKGIFILNVCMFFSNFSFVILISWVPVFLSNMMDISLVGLSFLFFSLLGAIGSLTMGLLSDKWGRENVFILSNLISSLLSFLYMAKIKEFLFLQTSLVGFFSVPFWILLTLMAQERTEERLSATALIQTSALLGGLISPLILGLLLPYINMEILIGLLVGLPFFLSSLLIKIKPSSS